MADVPDSAMLAGRDQSSTALNSRQGPARGASGPLGFRGLRALDAHKRFPLAYARGVAYALPLNRLMAFNFTLSLTDRKTR